MFLVPRGDVRCDFRIKILFGSSLSPFVCFIDVLCIDIHVAYWCLTRFSFHMMFVSFNSTRQVSLVERTILEHLCSHPVLSGVCVAQSSGFCIVFYRSLFVLLDNCIVFPSLIYDIRLPPLGF